jgi:Na+-translocating ferredoxin:NAD+ oxidoreductase RnfD subunit
MKFDLPFILKIFGSMMAFVYAGLGAFFIFTDINIPALSQTYRIVFGVVLLGYGIYRIYRTLSALRKQNED